MHEFNVDAPSPLPVISYDGCHICIITLACGHKLTGLDLTIFSDLSSGRIVPPTFIHLEVPPAFDDFLSVLPPLDELLIYNTKTSANLDLIRTLQHDVTFLKRPPPKINKALAQPISMKMVYLKRLLRRQLSCMSNFTTSIWMKIVSFVISMLLHLLVGYIYRRANHYQKMLPLRPRHPRHDNPIRLKPVLSVEDCDYYYPSSAGSVMILIIDL